MYITIQQTYRMNGDRHLERAIAYISAGYHNKYADGSLVKAKRNYEMAKKLDKFLPAIVFKTLADSTLDETLNMIARSLTESIIHGIGFYHQDEYDYYTHIPNKDVYKQ